MNLDASYFDAERNAYNADTPYYNGINAFGHFTDPKIISKKKTLRTESKDNFYGDASSYYNNYDAFGYKNPNPSAYGSNP